MKKEQIIELCLIIIGVLLGLLITIPIFMGINEGAEYNEFCRNKIEDSHYLLKMQHKETGFRKPKR